ncbi:hypothetical protein CDD80_2486 [Ophiocordyceps camponoti-rufipedis]|uniref:Uncharacterized protein n=1 Tax=Ophiocordyceps camponoti-rufipedis TaxID=2004952 RepID=A0A2C5Z681_9HYPO|nr:hypothetical protein CDD80_2486 [Ophiocordyceps camponoti-rufipedis]
MKFALFLVFFFAGMVLSAPIAKGEGDVPWRPLPIHKSRGKFQYESRDRVKPNFKKFVKELFKNHVGEIRTKDKVEPLLAIGAQIQGGIDKLLKDYKFPKKFDPWNAAHWYQIGGPEFLNHIDLSGLKKDVEKNKLYQLFAGYIDYVRSTRRKGDVLQIPDLPEPFPKIGRKAE